MQWHFLNLLHNQWFFKGSQKILEAFTNKENLRLSSTTKTYPLSLSPSPTTIKIEGTTSVFSQHHPGCWPDGVPGWPFKQPSIFNFQNSNNHWMSSPFDEISRSPATYASPNLVPWCLVEIACGLAPKYRIGNTCFNLEKAHVECCGKFV